MLTDTALKQLKSKDKPYKVADRDGMYIHIATSGFTTFRYDYPLNGRRESLVLGKYGRGGISLLTAREMCIEARRSVAAGNSPAQDKQRAKRMLKEAKSFGQFGARWLNDAQMADSTRAMRKSVLPVTYYQLLTSACKVRLNQMILGNCAQK